MACYLWLFHWQAFLLLTKFKTMTHLYLFILSPLLFGLMNHLILAQMQPDIPQPRGPVDLSDPVNVVIFIVLPLIVIIGFFFWRNAMKKKRKEEEEKKEQSKNP